MRFSTESVALSAAILALPAIAAPVPAQSATTSQVQPVPQSQGSSESQTGYFDVPSQPGTAHLAQHGFEQTSQVQPQTGGIRTNPHFQAGYQAGQYHAVSKIPVRPVEGTVQSQTMQQPSGQQQPPTQQAPPTQQQPSTQAPPTIPSKVKVNGRMVRIPQPVTEELERRAGRTQSIVDGVNKASQIGGAVNDLVQTGTSLWDSAKSAWEDIKNN